MSDAESEKWDDSDLSPWVGPDDALQLLARLANEAGLQLDVRLFLGAGVLSGTLVGGNEFYQELRRTLVKPDGVDRSANMATLIDFLAEPYTEDDKSDPAAVITVFVHLERARLFSPGQAPLEIGSWRGRLSAVQGWAIGSYSTEG